MDGDHIFLPTRQLNISVVSMLEAVTNDTTVNTYVQALVWTHDSISLGMYLEVDARSDGLCLMFSGVPKTSSVAAGIILLLHQWCVLTSPHHYQH